MSGHKYIWNGMVHGEGKHPVKKDKWHIFWDQNGHLNKRSGKDPSNFSHSLVKREDSMDIAMIIDKFFLISHP